MGWFLFIVLPIITTVAVGLLGTTRRIGWWGALFFSLLLTPVGGFIVTMVSGPKPKKKRRLTA